MQILYFGFLIIKLYQMLCSNPGVDENKMKHIKWQTDSEHTKLPDVRDAAWSDTDTEVTRVKRLLTSNPSIPAEGKKTRMYTFLHNSDDSKPSEVCGCFLFLYIYIFLPCLHKIELEEQAAPNESRS